MSSQSRAFARRVKDAEKQIFNRIGREDIKHLKTVVTTDEMGRTSLIVPQTPIFLVGDVQPLTEADSLILDEGRAKVGDVKLYSDFDVDGNPVDINLRDEIEFDGKTYRVVEQIERVTLDTEVVHNSWLLRLRS